VLLLLLPEEIGFCAVAGKTEAQKRNEAARHRGNAGSRWKDDLVRKDTIRIRRSTKV
jgi:hypothetical protein